MTNDGSIIHSHYIRLDRADTKRANEAAKTVNEVRRKKQIIYECELCGFGYSEPETAEHCEQYCYSHGKTSSKIARKAIRKPILLAEPIHA